MEPAQGPRVTKWESPGASEPSEAHSPLAVVVKNRAQESPGYEQRASDSVTWKHCLRRASAPEQPRSSAAPPRHSLVYLPGAGSGALSPQPTRVLCCPKHRPSRGESLPQCSFSVGVSGVQGGAVLHCVGLSYSVRAVWHPGTLTSHGVSVGPRHPHACPMVPWSRWDHPQLRQ